MPGREQESKTAGAAAAEALAEPDGFLTPGERSLDRRDYLSHLVFGHGVVQRQGQDPGGDIVGHRQCRELGVLAKIVLFGYMRRKVIG